MLRNAIDVVHSRLEEYPPPSREGLCGRSSQPYRVQDELTFGEYVLTAVTTTVHWVVCKSLGPLC